MSKYKLVPVNPTLEMIAASNEAIRWYEPDATSRACYQAMLDAAPQFHVRSPIREKILAILKDEFESSLYTPIFEDVADRIIKELVP